MPASYKVGSHFDALIEDLVQAGRYTDADEVVRDGLRLIEEREIRLKALDAAIARGLADAEAGKVHSIDAVRAYLDQSTKSA